MKRLFVFLGLAGAAAAAVAAMRSGEGALRRGVERGAEAVRKGGPVVADTLARGIEGAGAVSEKLAARVAERASHHDDEGPSAEVEEGSKAVAGAPSEDDERHM